MDTHTIGPIACADVEVVDFFDEGVDGAIVVDLEPAVNWAVETADVENELVVEENPDVVVTREFEAFFATSGNFDGKAEMGSEAEIVFFAAPIF